MFSPEVKQEVLCSLKFLFRKLKQKEGFSVCVISNNRITDRRMQNKSPNVKNIPVIQKEHVQNKRLGNKKITTTLLCQGSKVKNPETKWIFFLYLKVLMQSVMKFIFILSRLSHSDITQKISPGNKNNVPVLNFNKANGKHVKKYISLSIISAKAFLALKE